MHTYNVVLRDHVGVAYTVGQVKAEYDFDAQMEALKKWGPMADIRRADDPFAVVDDAIRGLNERAHRKR